MDLHPPRTSRLARGLDLHPPRTSRLVKLTGSRRARIDIFITKSLRGGFYHAVPSHLPCDFKALVFVRCTGWEMGYSNGEIRKIDKKKLVVSLPRPKGIPFRSLKEGIGLLLVAIASCQPTSGER
jgi:hypothetical protein